MIDTKGLILFIFVLIVVVGVIIYDCLKSPFSYPYFIHEFNVSRKRNPQIDDYIDKFLISGGFKHIKNHQDVINAWKKDSQQQIERSILKNLRSKQYERVIDDKCAYKFIFVRAQTRYKQRNYVKSAYKVNVQTNYYEYNYIYIVKRYNQLAEINFECTLKEYHSKNQRKLVTRELRERIMERDDYTCQLCGKYMPDEVGLQIDHIIPVSKGGKSVESNLRVLCSKCNGSKSNKMKYNNINYQEDLFGIPRDLFGM